MKMSRVAVLVLGIFALLGVWLAADAKGEPDQQALAEIEKLKGVVVPFPFSVSFDGRGVGDEALVHVQKLTDLEALYMRRCKVTDAGLKKLAKLSKLKYLYLGNTPITDKGLVHLKGLRNLQALSLVGTKVTDKGLAHLKGLRSLKVLELTDTKVTDAGVAKLKKSLPGLFVRK
jgi:Leucine-rich repeat (LRR) protein